MFQQISDNCIKYSSNIASLYISENGNVYFQRYKDVVDAALKLGNVFKEFEGHGLVGVRLGHRPSLLPVIFSLLQSKITFALFDDDESFETNVELRFNAIVTSGNWCNDAKITCSNQVIVKTEGCVYNIYKYNKTSDVTMSFDNICYIARTSGTLGAPKLVRVTVTSIYSNIKSFINLFEINADDVIYFGTPLSFDPSIIELFLALTTGSCLFATSKNIRRNPKRLLQVLFMNSPREKNVTFLQMCPALFLQFSEMEMEYILSKSTLRILGLGGEPFPRHILKHNKGKKCKIYNFYGITELSCWASVSDITNLRATEDIALGNLLDETLFCIETDKGMINNWEKFNCEGILHIGSSTRICLLANEELDNTQCAFRSSGDIVTVENGKIYFKGRSNDIIKRYGQRISLLKLQNTISELISLPNICIYHKEKLIIFIKLAGFTTETKSKITDKIRVKLLNELESKYMPDYYELLEEFPILQHNGKLDKKMLEMISEQLVETIIMKNPIKIFSYLWKKYISDGKICGNFWECGGNSILAMQFASIYEEMTSRAFDRQIFNLNYNVALKFIENTSSHSLTELVNASHANCFRIKWQCDMNACIDSPPNIILESGKEIIAVGNFAHHFGLFDGGTGQEIANIILANVIESSSSYAKGAHYVSCFDGCLYCLSGNLEIKWCYRTSQQIKNKPLFDHQTNNIIFCSYDKNIYCINEESKDSTLRWKQYLGEAVTAEVKLLNNGLYVGGIKGTLFSLNRESGKSQWKYALRNPVFTPCELISRTIFAVVDVRGIIYAFSFNHELLWLYDSFPTEHTTFAPLFIINESIFLGSQNGNINIFHFDKQHCTLVNTLTSDKDSNISISLKPVYFRFDNKKYLLFVNNMGQLLLYLLNNDLGSEMKLVAQFQLPAECYSSPQKSNIYDNIFYLGCRDNHLYCVEINI